MLKRCRTLSPAHMVLPNIMEMIAALGPGSVPFPALSQPPAGAATDYSTPGTGGPMGARTEPHSCVCVPPQFAPFPLTGSSFLGPGGFPEPFGAPGVPGTSTLSDFTPGPPSISYQPNIPGGLLAPEKPPVPPLPAQVSWVVCEGHPPSPDVSLWRS